MKHFTKADTRPALEADFFPTNQSFFRKLFKFALIGWIKADPPKKPLLF